MKVLIDNKPEEFINIFRPSGGSGKACPWWQCNTTGNKTAHTFNTHPSQFPKDEEIKTNGHIYIFPSKQN
jgi:hypothetical protein